MNHVVKILRTARVKYTQHEKWPQGDVFVTDARQLIGTLRELDAFRRSRPEYKDWRPRPVVELESLMAMGVTKRIPKEKKMVAVLMPKNGQTKRMDRAFADHMTFAGNQATPNDLREAYQMSFAKVAAYSGGNKAKIRKELYAIADAVMAEAKI